MGFRSLVAMTVVAMAAWVAWSWSSQGPSPVAVGAGAVPAAPSFESRGPLARTGREPAVVSRLQVDPSATAWRCSGRCVEQVSGVAIAGCAVRSGEQVVVTDRSGRFELQATGARTVVEISSADFVWVRRTIERRGAMVDLGSVQLRAAGRVAGLLTDEYARPCGNRIVVVEPQSFAVRRDGWRELLEWNARTAADGSFVLGTPLPAGSLLVSAPELPSLLGSSTYALRAGQELFLPLRCGAWQQEQELSGIVLDARGQSAAGAMVQVCRDASGERVSKIVGCDESGRFFVVCERGARSPVWLRASAASGSLESPVRGPHRWGGSPVRLDLVQSHGVWLHVVDAVDQTPIESFAVQSVPTSGVRSSTAGARRGDGHHEGGRCWLQLADGGHEVMVWPRDSRWLPNLPQAFRVGTESRHVTVALRRAQNLAVRVLHNNGRAVAGATVRLIQPADNEVVRELSQLLMHGGSSVRPNVVVATSRTDAQGSAALRWSDDLAMQVRVHGPGVVPQVVSRVRFEAGVATIRVAEAGVLRVRSPAAKGLRLVLTQRGTVRRLPEPWSAPMVLDDSGEQEVDVPVGEWQMRLAVPLPNGEWRSLPDALATVQIASGRVSEYAPSTAAQLVVGEVAGQVHVDGLPATQVVLLHGAAMQDGSIVAVATSVLPADARGGYRFTQLHTGYYALQARVMCSGQQVAIRLVDWFRLQAGGERNCGAQVVTTAPLTIRLRSSDGAIVRGGQLLLRGSNGALLVGAPDEHGAVTFSRVPSTSYELQLRQRGKTRPLGRVHVAPGADTKQTVLVR